MTPFVSVLSSMATRQSLAELAQAYERASGIQVAVTSIGGVDAARRLRDGAMFDVVVLADGALHALAADGFVAPATIAVFARSATAIAIRGGRPRPETCDADTIKQMILAARAIGVSTGPSGASLRKLVAAWELDDSVTGRFVEAAPGVPVARLVAGGKVDIGFQQLSEMMGEPGVAVAGVVPEALMPLALFSIGRATACANVAVADALMTFLGGHEARAALSRHGLMPAS